MMENQAEQTLDCGSHRSHDHLREACTPGVLQTLGLQRVRQDLVTEQQNTYTQWNIIQLLKRNLAICNNIGIAVVV